MSNVTAPLALHAVGAQKQAVARTEPLTDLLQEFPGTAAVEVAEVAAQEEHQLRSPRELPQDPQCLPVLRGDRVHDGPAASPATPVPWPTAH